MKKFLFSIIAVFMTVSLMNAQSVMVVNDNNVSGPNTEFHAIVDALIAGGYTYDSIDFQVVDTILYSEISNYDFIIWYTGNDRVAINLWDTTSTTDTAFYPALQQYYDNGEGAIWIDGLDVILPILVQTTIYSTDYDAITRPYAFHPGNIIHDVLGIASWDYESKTDEGTGVPQLDKSSTNTITTLDPIQWTYSAGWRYDGWTPVSGAISLYEMGDATYAGAGYTSFHKYVNNGIELYFSSVRLGRMGNGSTFVQDSVNKLVDEICKDVTVYVAINEVSNSPKFNIYPNPTSEYFNIDVSKLSNVQINVYSLSGRNVISESIKGNARIDVNNLSTGIYNVVITSNEGVSSKKLIIQ